MQYDIDYKVTSVFTIQVEADSEEDARSLLRYIDWRNEVADNILDGGLHNDEISIENVKELNYA